MKSIIAIIIALLAGLAVGSWSVKSDLRKARKENDELKEQLAKRTTRQDSIRTITTMLRVPEPSARPAPATPPPPVPATTNQPAPTASTNAPDAHPSFEEGIKTATELWKTRSALARDGFLQNINASPVQIQMFDQAVAAMNKELGDKIKQWADYLKSQKDVTPETGVRMMNDLSGTIVNGYDDLDRVLANDWRDKAGDKFQMFDFINPEVALPLSEVENLSAMRPGRRHRHE